MGRNFESREGNVNGRQGPGCFKSVGKEFRLGLSGLINGSLMKEGIVQQETNGGNDQKKAYYPYQGRLKERVVGRRGGELEGAVKKGYKVQGKKEVKLRR